MACVHKERWLEVMLDELTSLSERSVLELCELPPGHKLVAGKWVFVGKSAHPEGCITSSEDHVI